MNTSAFSELLKPDALRQYAIQGNGILGIRGSGKSWTGKVMAENLLDAGIPFIAFDPIGVWRHMKLPSATGGRGFKVVVAGENADLPLTPDTAPQIVRAAMRENIPVVIDLFSINLSKEDWRKIVQRSVEILIHENAAHGIRHIFIEEAAEFVPQRIQPGQGMVYSTIEKLVRMGGNSSLGVTLINQRAEEVNKAVLELCDLLILHRQKGKNSLNSLEKWIEFSEAEKSTNARDIVRKLPTLSAGECYVWREQAEAPLLMKVPALKSFHPDRSRPVAMKAELASNVTDFIARIQKITKIEQKIVAEETAPLLERIQLLEADVEHWQAEASKPRAGFVTLEELEALRDGYNANLERMIEDRNTLQGFIEKMRVGVADGGIYMPVQPVVRAQKVSYPSQSSEKNSSGIRRMMIAIAQRPGINRKQLGLRAGLSSKGGTFGTYLGKIRSAGWLNDLDGGCFELTKEGLKELGKYERLPEGEALREYWLGELGGGAARMLMVLCQAYPRGLTREELGRRAEIDYKGGTFGTYLGKLKTLELVDGKKELKASEELF